MFYKNIQSAVMSVTEGMEWQGGKASGGASDGAVEAYLSPGSYAPEESPAEGH